MQSSSDALANARLSRHALAEPLQLRSNLVGSSTPLSRFLSRTGSHLKQLPACLDEKIVIAVQHTDLPHTHMLQQEQHWSTLVCSNCTCIYEYQSSGTFYTLRDMPEGCCCCTSRV
jgi:hypothetical protein